MSSKDLYKSLSSSSNDDRLKAAVSLMDSLVKSNDDEEWDKALKKLTSGLNTSSEATHLGYSITLTELLNERSKKINIDSYLDLLPQIKQYSSEQEDQKIKNSYSAVFFGIQALTNSKLFSKKAFTLQHFEKIIDSLFILIQSPTFKEIVVNCLYLIIGKLATVKFDEDKALDYVLKNLKESPISFSILSPEGISISLAAAAIGKSKRVEKAFPNKGWISGNPLVKGNFVNLSNTLQTTFPVAPKEDNRKSKKNKKGNKPQKRNFNDFNTISPVKPAQVWLHVAEAFSTIPDISEDSHDKKKKKSEKKHDKEYIGFSEFWNAVIDNTLFNNSSDLTQNFYGYSVFSIFLKAFESAPQYIPALFSNNLMKHLCDKRTNQQIFKSQNNKKGKSTTNNTPNSIDTATASIINVGKSTPSLVPVLLKSIYATDMGPNFDNLTSSQTTRLLLQYTSTSDIPEMVTFFLKQFLIPFEEGDKAEDMSIFDVEWKRKWALDKLVQLIRLPIIAKTVSDYSWLDEVFNILISNAYFKITASNAGKTESDKKSDSKKRKANDPIEESELVNTLAMPSLSSKSVKYCQQIVNSIIAISVSFKRPDETSWPYIALSKLIKFTQNPASLSPSLKLEPLLQFDGDLLKQQKKALTTLEKIRNKRQASRYADTPQLQAFELLFSLVLFQVYTSDDESGQVLEEVQTCYNSFQSKTQTDEDPIVDRPKSSSVSSSNSSNGEKKADDDEDEEEEEGEIDAGQILTEILLGFISRESALLKKVSEAVWRSFSGKISRASLQLLYDVLEKKETTEGQSELFENLDEDEDDDEEKDDEEDDEEEEEDDDDDEEDEKEQKSEESVIEKDDEEEKDEDLTEKERIEKVENESRLKLAKALGINGEADLAGKGDVDDDESSEDEDDDESMDDEQMMALDGHLAMIFKERQQALSNTSMSKLRKKEKRAARHAIVQFKTRVVDFLEIYFQTQQSSESESIATGNPSDADSNSALVLTMIVPLLNVVKNTSDKALGEKCVNLLKKHICRIKVTEKLVNSIKEDIFVPGKCCDDGCNDCEHDSNQDGEVVDLSNVKDEDEDEEMEDDEEDDEDKKTKKTDDDESSESGSGSDGNEEDSSDEEDDEEEEDPSVTTSDIIAWFHQTHIISQNSTRIPLSQACSQASIFLSKILITKNKQFYTPIIVDTYSKTMENWILKKSSKVKAQMFTDFVSWVGTVRDNEKL